MKNTILILLVFAATIASAQESSAPDDAYNTTLGQLQGALLTQHFDEYRAIYGSRFKKDDTTTPDARERYVYYTFSLAEMDALEGKNKDAWAALLHLVKFKEFENWDDIAGNVAFDSLRKDSKTNSLIAAAMQRLAADAKDEKDPLLTARLKALAARDRTNTTYNAEDSARYIAIQNSLTDSAIAILDKYGYPGPSVVGGQATTIARIISKAPIAIQKKYKALLYTEGNKGNIPNGLAGIILDQISVAEKGKQSYGTQYHLVKGNIVFYPTEELATVEARRKKMGFKLTMKEYQKRTMEGR